MNDNDLLAEYDASKAHPSQEWVDYESLADDLAAALRVRDADLATARSARPTTWAEVDVLRADLATARAVTEGVLTCCRDCHDQEPPVTTPAEFILWGKLLPPEALGPKCYDHAVKHVGSSMPSRPDQYAVVDLRPLRAWLASVSPPASGDD